MEQGAGTQGSRQEVSRAHRARVQSRRQCQGSGSHRGQADFPTYTLTALVFAVTLPVPLADIGRVKHHTSCLSFDAPPRLPPHWFANGNRIHALGTASILAAPLLSRALPVSTALWLLKLKALGRLFSRAGSDFDSIIFASFHSPGCQDPQSKEHRER